MNGLFLHPWRGHELANGFEDALELSVILPLQGIHFLSQFPMGAENFPQSYKNFNDGDIDLHSPLTV